VQKLKAQPIFPSKPNFCNSFECPAQNPFKNQHVPHLCSENCGIKTLFKSDLLSSAFQQHEEHPQIPIEIFSIDFILFS
jgi:hypothetical protein